MSSIADEALAFDERIRERVAHGYVPDLRRGVDCDWFYNNPWRRPYLTDQVFGVYLRFALQHLSGERVLELGCGAGHMALELARLGYDVTGIDVSPESIRVAREVAASSTRDEGFGALRYVASDFLEWEAEDRFDSVCVFCSLHHFHDPERVVDRVLSLLRPGGRLVVVEPDREAMTSHEATVIYLMRLLLAQGGRWYEALPLPATEREIEEGVDAVLDEYRDAHEPTEDAQSPHDNASGTAAMLAALRSRFDEVTLEPGLAFHHRMGGGVRGNDEPQARELATFLSRFDRYAVTRGLLRPNMLYWAGAARAPRTPMEDPS